MTANNKHTKALAVIMSVYSGDSYPYVKSAIDSLLRQTYTDFDLYICIDGKIANKVAEYLNAMNEQNIHIYTNETNAGLAKSMNLLLGYVLAQKNYACIARMDADDINAPERLEQQIHFLDANPQTDCVGTWAIEIDADGNEFFRKQMPCTHDQCFDFFAKRDCMIHPTVMFRRSFFEKAGLYPEDTYFGEDTMMWAKGFSAGCRYANIPEYLYYFRLNDQFFDRRRGIRHARSIWELRCRVNSMLHYGLKAYFYAAAYAFAKLMPERLLNRLYKTVR